MDGSPMRDVVEEDILVKSHRRQRRSEEGKKL